MMRLVRRSIGSVENAGENPHCHYQAFYHDTGCEFKVETFRDAWSYRLKRPSVSQISRYGMVQN